MKTTRSFDQTVLRWLKKHEVANETLYVAVSGGVDSIVMLEVLSKWSRTLNLDLKVVHINHGGLKRRSQAQKFVQEWAKKKQLVLLTNAPIKEHVKSTAKKQLPSKKQLRSEEELRDFRWAEIARLIAEDVNTKKASAGAKGVFTIATAHHMDDLIETQLIRLLRGTGQQGVKGMDAIAIPRMTGVRTQAGQSQSLTKIRPLIELSRKEILTYARLSKLKWFEDVSNGEIEPLRNWLRHKWIAPLEKKNAGLKTSLARSLSLLANAKPLVDSSLTERLIQQDKISLQEFLTLTRDQKEAVLAFYMHKLNLRNYSKNHITEVLKQLDTGRRELSFKLLQREWFINAQHIFCRPSQLDI